MPTITKLFSMAEVAKHNTKDDCWVVIDGKVYDVTTYLDEHPGGDDVFFEATGKDAKEEFEDAGHSKDAREQMESFLIGELDLTEVEEPEPCIEEKEGMVMRLKEVAVGYWGVPLAVVGISVAVVFVCLRKK